MALLAIYFGEREGKRQAVAQTINAKRLLGWLHLLEVCLVFM